MAFQLAPFADIGLDQARLTRLLERHAAATRPRLERLWAYYRNPAIGGGAGEGRWRTRLAQERGLPARLRGRSESLRDDRDRGGREVVIENDIAWRLHTLVDFMAPRSPAILSTARDERTRDAVQRILDAALEASGGVALLQDAALLASIFGHVDLLVRADALFGPEVGTGRGEGGVDAAVEAARGVRIEIAAPTRAAALVSASDYRTLDGYVLCVEGEEDARHAAADRAGLLERLRRRIGGADEAAAAGRGETVEIFSASHWQRYVNGRLVAQAPNRLGVVPVVHIQNQSQPFRYEGLSDVEPLIPLQDELNTRLSDRAHRVTLQSFKMYLARGVDGFGDGAETPVAPGRVWSTDNPEASIEAFGGDISAPSEDRHIDELREAMDKTSAVTPLAAGLLRARIGQLSSENALRVTLLGTLAKTRRKQMLFSRGVAQLSELVLRALDASGAYGTDSRDRGVRVEWPDPLPRAEQDRLSEAQAKVDLGVPRERVLAELGYAPVDPGVT